MTPQWHAQPADERRVGRHTLMTHAFLLEYYQSPANERWYWRVVNPHGCQLAGGDRPTCDEAIEWTLRYARMIGVVR